MTLRDEAPTRDDWRSEAACRGNHMFTNPQRATRHELAVMTAMCAACPVYRECRADMDATRDYVGVRAGVVWAEPDRGGHRVPRAIGPCVCAHCGNVYERPEGVTNTKYCSNACRVVARRLMDNASARVRMREMRMWQRNKGTS